MAKPRRCTQKHKPMSPSSLTFWPCESPVINGCKRVKHPEPRYTLSCREAVYEAFRTGNGTRDLMGPDGLTTEKFVDWGEGLVELKAGDFDKRLIPKRSETTALWALKPPGVGRKESGGPAGQGRTCRNLHW